MILLWCAHLTVRDNYLLHDSKDHPKSCQIDSNFFTLIGTIEIACVIDTIKLFLG